MTERQGQQVLQTQLLPLKKIQTNSGQIPGLPKNPRTIRDSKYTQLKKSIIDFPYMLSLREVVVFPFKGKYVCVGGNMRLIACRELDHEEIPAKVLPKDFPIERLREFAIKDNANFGQDDYDLLAAEWTDFPLLEWGADIPDLTGVDLDDFFKEDDPKDEKATTYTIVLSYSNEKECEKVRALLGQHGETLEAAVYALLKL